MISSLRAALQFLTILPLGRSKDFSAHKMAVYFPVVGLVIGSILALTDNVLQRFFPLPIVSLIDVLLLAVVTGALHLDGLADTADGLFSHRSREEALKIMKDSRVGTMGVLALVFVLGVKWAGLSSLHGHRALCLIVIPAFARSAFTVAIQFLDYVRPEGGTAESFFEGDRGFSRCRWLLAPVALSLIIGLKGIFLIAAFIGVAGVVIHYYKRRFGGITGDMLGALGEVTEASLFLLAGIGV